MEGMLTFGNWSRQWNGRQALMIARLDVIAELPPEAPCQTMVAQQIASADSIASNIEEGFGRGSKKEFAQFLFIARGSAQEAAGRYQRLRHWLPADVIIARVALCGEIIAILTATISTLRAQMK